MGEGKEREERRGCECGEKASRGDECCRHQKEKSAGGSKSEGGRSLEEVSLDKLLGVALLCLELTYVWFGECELSQKLGVLVSHLNSMDQAVRVCRTDHTDSIIARIACSFLLKYAS